MLLDAIRDGIWEVTLDLPAGGHEYKFVNGGSVKDVVPPLEAFVPFARLKSTFSVC